MKKKNKTSANKSKADASTKGSVQQQALAASGLGKRLREGSFLFVVAAAGFWLLALFSYHLSDSGWASYNSNHTIENAAGIAGAWVADFTLYFCGYLAFLLPLILCYVGWNYCFKGRGGTAVSRMARILQAVGLVFVVLAAAALVNMFVHKPVSPLPLGSGGVMGEVVAQYMVHLFNVQGAILLLYAVILVGITLSSGLSWLKLMEWVGRGVWRVLQWSSMQSYRLLTVRLPQIAQALWHKIGKAWGAWQEQRVAKREQQAAIRAEKQAAPAEKTPDIKIFSQQKATPDTAEKVATTSVEDRLAALKAKTQATASSGELAAHLQPTPGQMPTLELLDEHVSQQKPINTAEIERQSRDVELKLADFGVKAQVVAVHPGPVVTRYEIELAAGTKASKITALSKDLARSLSVLSVRVVEVIPGKSVVGIELPNEQRDLVSLREVFASDEFVQSSSTLTMALGKTIAGRAVSVDLAKMPHLLVAGTTGSGKSVGLNAMLLSLLYKSTPEQLRIILIDPKMLELAIYEDIPHLLVPVVTDMKEAANALRWCVVEMERRYRLMAALGVRNIAGFNQKVADAIAKGEPIADPMIEQHDALDTAAATLSELPKIVIIADEFADMMMVVGKKIETLIARLAQKARAAGIHLIFATQRPSVDVITGLIKANIPTRIAFQVSSRIDSRTILDQQGAEHLLGHGDSLYLAPGSGIPQRVHGAFVSDEEVHRVVSFLKAGAKPNYLTEILSDTQQQNVAHSDPVLASMDGGGSGNNEHDSLFDQAVEFVAQSRRASISGVQRRFKIGYNRAARIVEQMEAEGMVGPMESSGAREVLLPKPRKDD